MSEVSGNPKSPKVIKGLDSIRREDFLGEVSYRLAIAAAEKDLEAAGYIKKMDGDIPSAIKSASLGLTLLRKCVETAQSDYDASQEMFREFTSILRFGGIITFGPSPGRTLSVMRWAGSEYYERHDTERILGEGDTFDALSLSWDHTDGMLKGYDSSIAGDTRSSWVELPYTATGPTFEVVAVELPDIVIEGEGVEQTQAVGVDNH